MEVLAFFRDETGAWVFKFTEWSSIVVAAASNTVKGVAMPMHGLVCHHMTWFLKKADLSCGVPWAFRPAQKLFTPHLRRRAKDEGIYIYICIYIYHIYIYMYFL